MWNSIQNFVQKQLKRRSNFCLSLLEPAFFPSKPVHSPDQSVLEIAAEELRSGGLRSSEVQASLQQQEEGTVYAQILHFINLMINFRVPLNAAASLIPATDQSAGSGVATTPTASQGNANFVAPAPSGGQQHQHQQQRGMPNGWPSNQVNGVSDRRDLPFAR